MVAALKTTTIVMREEKMHPLNRVLSLLGLQLSKIDKHVKQKDDDEKAFRQRLDDFYKLAEKNKRGFKIFRAYRYQVGVHPSTIQDLEFEFAAYHIHKIKPLNILDIGSYRHFILGVLAYYNVTTLEIRKRNSLLDNENIITCDAKALKLSDGAFDVVVSLEALPHFGLGRYGDDFDLDADMKAFNEMVRVLKPGGCLIFSTAITRAEPTIAFNARRNYNYAMIREFCRDLECIEEKFIDRRNKRFCLHDDLTTDPNLFDYYIACWKKITL